MKPKVGRMLPRLWKKDTKVEDIQSLDVSKEPEIMGFEVEAGGEKKGMVRLERVPEEMMAGSESWGTAGSSSSAGDPVHSPSDPVSLNNSRMTMTQNIIEPGANRWEVHGLWIMKRCAGTTKRSLSKISTQMMLGVLSSVVISLVVFHWYSGPERHVKRFLTNIDLVEYYDSFIQAKYTWLEDVVHISKVEDLQAIGMTYRSHQERFLRHAERIRNQESLVLAIMWGIFILMMVCFMIVVVSILTFEEARNRAAFFVTWSCLMLWHRIRMYSRLWKGLDVRSVPCLCSLEDSMPTTPNSADDPPIGTETRTAPHRYDMRD